MQLNARDVNLAAAGSPDAEAPSSGKLAWHTPSIEEVPFTRTEAGGVGAMYDLTVYAGSR
jgi:hypothetical protein